MSSFSNPNTNPVEAMLAQTALSRTAFAPGSRYYNSRILTIEQNGRPVAYLARRFLPRLDQFQIVETAIVAQGDRPDLLAAKYLGDPTQFWRLCDVNAVDRPQDLTATPGRTIAIALPPGIRGTTL
jgi:hypothetical protein